MLSVHPKWARNLKKPKFYQGFKGFHALLARHRRAALDGTRILCQTDPAPGIPFITRVDRGAAFAARLHRCGNAATVVGDRRDPRGPHAEGDLRVEGAHLLGSRLGREHNGEYEKQEESGSVAHQLAPSL